MNNLDKLFGMSTPEELDITKTRKYFSDLERAISRAVRDNKYSEDKDAIYSIEEIETEFGWVSDKIEDLFSWYEDAYYLLDYYRGEVESRLDDDEKKELVSLKVQEKLEKCK